MQLSIACPCDYTLLTLKYAVNLLNASSVLRIFDYRSCCVLFYIRWYHGTIQYIPGVSRWTRRIDTGKKSHFRMQTESRIPVRIEQISKQIQFQHYRESNEASVSTITSTQPSTFQMRNLQLPHTPLHTHPTPPTTITTNITNTYLDEC